MKGKSKAKNIVCHKLRGLLVENCLTYKDIGKVIGKSEGTVAQKINGHREWTLGECILTAKLFDMKVEEVFPELTQQYSKVS